MKRAVILVVVFLAFAGLIGGYGYFQFVVKPEMVKGFITGAAQPPVAVAAAPAETAIWVPTLPAVGTFHAVQGIAVAPQVDGVVKAVQFESGQEAAAGTLLVQLDDSVEQADLRSGLAELKRTELELERQRELFSRGNAAKTTFDAAQAARDVAAAAVDRTRAAIAHKAIKAPFAGRLGLQQVELGQYVSRGAALVTLQQLDPIEVDFPVPETEFGRIAVGQSLEIRVDAYPEVFPGRIVSIDARADDETRAVTVRGGALNPERKLLPGMYAEVMVAAGAPVTRVTVPRTAVTYSLYGDSVYVVKRADAPPAAAPAASGSGAQASPPPPSAEALVAERRFVRTGETREDRVAILEGVAAGELVVVAGQIKLRPGARVVVDNRVPLAGGARPKE